MLFVPYDAFIKKIVYIFERCGNTQFRISHTRIFIHVKP